VTVHLLYFADAREAVGSSEERLELPPGIATVGALRELLCARGGPWTTLGRSGTRFAVNRVVAPGAGAPIRDGDEVAVFPAISGG
jgi:molybdopterin synthase sulfur carrier subunit